jgi:2',3'-cyclic-nucleotide 2'-phosphodiesterase (5'-nucleotidase family)
LRRLPIYLVLFFLLSACSKYFSPRETQTQHYSLKQTTGDSLSQVSIAPYKNKLDADMKIIVASSDSALTREGPEPLVGNFVMQAMDHFVSEHKPKLKGNRILVMNYGGLRNTLPSGAITRRSIFELMPFDNELVVIGISGKKLKDCVASMAANGKLLSTDIAFTLEDKLALDVKVNGKEIDEAGTYTIVTTDYLAMGGDNCVFFKEPLYFENSTIKLRDAIIGYCEFLTRHNETIKPYRHGRIKISK